MPDQTPFIPRGSIPDRAPKNTGGNPLIVERSGAPSQAQVAPGDIPRDLTSHPCGRGAPDSAGED